MNYYEHHLGDYDGATSHLSWLEDCAYRRLMGVYYRTEAPLPVELAQACRLVRAFSKPERQAVAQVLNEFFELQADGWHQKRCDEAIAVFREQEPVREQEREQKRIHAAERQRRARERRADLFTQLRAFDIVPAFDTPTADLSRQLSHAKSVTGSVTGSVTTTPVTRDDTTTQSPIPIPIPIPNEESVCSLPHTHAGAACKAMREAGIADVNPANPTLLEMLRQGITVEELRAAAVITMAAAVGPRRFSYALTVAQNERAKAAAVALAPPTAKKGNPFALPPGHVRVLPNDLPDLDMENDAEARHVDDARARG